MGYAVQNEKGCKKRKGWIEVRVWNADRIGNDVQNEDGWSADKLGHNVLLEIRVLMV